MITAKKRIQTDLRALLLVAAMLIVIGLIFIYSSSSVYAIEKFGVSYYFVAKQLIGLVLGVIAIFMARVIPLSFIKKCSPLFFFGSLILTAMTLVPGLSQHIHGSSRWVNLFGFGFQPSELIKISLILYLAYFLEKRTNKASSLAHTYIPLLIVLGATCGILLKQPDFGLTVTLLMTALAMLFMAQFNAKHMMITLAAIIPAIIALVLFKPYRLKRILTFLDPGSDPQGAGFQIIQSLIAVGSGGWLGVGIANSKQKFFYLPMQHTDFIFSIIAEETGFAGSLFLITLYALFLYFGIKIVWKLKDTFSMFAAFGFITLISLQTVINLAVVTGLAPTKGIGLPFVSYGNTALVCTMAMLGLIMNMVHNDK
ncbi:MAG: putative lipid II flippase FtsW [Candidatus Dependentiae bacterium]|nr:putative lipid II flippase FtsW [Candidatus Dependentiae bacterium]